LHTAFRKRVRRRDQDGGCDPKNVTPYGWGAYIITLTLTLNPGLDSGANRLYLLNEVIQVPHILVLFWTNFDIPLDDTVRLWHYVEM
jgi:hypothetical protein